MFRKVSITTQAIGLFFAGLSWLGVSGTAKAGWVFDHMEGSGGLFQNTTKLYKNGHMERAFNSSSTVNSETDGRGGWSSGGSSSLFSHQVTSNPDPVYGGSMTCKAKMSATIQPVFRWEPEEIDWDDETGDPIYGPVSTKPIWILEKANLEVTGFGGAVTMAESFKVNMKSSSTLPPQDDEDGRDPEPYTPDPIVHDEHLPFGRVTKWFEGKKFQRIDPVGDKAYGQPRTFEYEVSVTRNGFEALTDKMEAIVRYRYEVCEVHFGLMVRPLFYGNAGYAALTEGYNSGNGSMSGGRSLTAGGLDDAAHKCEVWMTMDPPVLGVLPSKCYPKVDFAFKKGKVKHAEFKTFMDPRPAPLVTDWSNFYQVYVGEAASRDVTTGKPTLYPAVMLGYGGQNPMAALEMTWANVAWRMGEDGAKEWDTSFAIGEDDYTEAIWARVLDKDNQPLVSHTYRFVPDRVVVRDEISPGTWKTKIFTTNPAEVSQYAGNPNYLVTFNDDLTGEVASYLTLSGTSGPDALGVCKGSVTVRASETFVVDSFQLALQDENVFRKRVP